MGHEMLLLVFLVLKNHRLENFLVVVLFLSFNVFLGSVFISSQFGLYRPVWKCTSISKEKPFANETEFDSLNRIKYQVSNIPIIVYLYT